MYYSNLQQVHYKSYKDLSLALPLPIGLYLIHLKIQLLSTCIMQLRVSLSYTVIDILEVLPNDTGGKQPIYQWKL